MPPFKPHQEPLNIPCGRAPRSPTRSRPAPDLVPPDLIEIIEPQKGRSPLATRPKALPAPAPFAARPAAGAPPWAAFRLGPAYLQPAAPAVRARGLALGAPAAPTALARVPQSLAPTQRQIDAVQRQIDGAGALGGVVMGLFRNTVSPDLYIDAMLPSGARAMAPVSAYGEVGPYTPWQDPAQTGAYPVLDLRLAEPRREPDADDAWRVPFAQYERSADLRPPVWGSPARDHAHAVLVALRNRWPVPPAVLHDYPAFRIVYGASQAHGADASSVAPRQRGALTLAHTPDDGTTLTVADASVWNDSDAKHLMDAYYRAVGGRRVSWIVDSAGRRQLYEEMSEGRARPRQPLAETAAELARQGFPQITVVEPAPVSDDEAKRRGEQALARRATAPDVVLVETAHTILAKPGRPGADRSVTIESVLGPRGFRWDSAARQWSLPGYDGDPDSIAEMLHSVEEGLHEIGLEVRVQYKPLAPSRKAASPPTPAPRKPAAKPSQPDVVITETGDGFVVRPTHYERDRERIAMAIALMGFVWNPAGQYWYTLPENRPLHVREELLAKVTAGLTRASVTFRVQYMSSSGHLSPTPPASPVVTTPKRGKTPAPDLAFEAEGGRLVGARLRGKPAADRDPRFAAINAIIAPRGLMWNPRARMWTVPLAGPGREDVDRMIAQLAEVGVRAAVVYTGRMNEQTTAVPQNPDAPEPAPRPSAKPAKAAPDAPVRLGHGIVIPAPAPQASMKVPSRKIPNDVMDVLRETRREGPRVFLPGQLERKLYEKTAEVLESIGAKWKRGSKKEPGAHVFADPERQEEFENLVSAGAYTTNADLSYFATPSELAERIVTLAGPLAGKNVLEPSAGEGAIVYWLLRAGARVTAVEFEPRRVKALESRYPNITIVSGDFLAIPAPNPPSFDAVVMNPPFSSPGRRHADIDHVLHAARFLKPGGTMVAIMLGSIAQRASDAQAREFRAFVESVGGTMDPVPAGTFKESGTLVPTVIVRFTLPTAHDAPSPKRLTSKGKRSP